MVKRGPPYLNNPHATFLVIDHPWGQTTPRNSQAFINAVGAWIRFMRRRSVNDNVADDILVDKIYTRKNVGVF